MTNELEIEGHEIQLLMGLHSCDEFEIAEALFHLASVDLGNPHTGFRVEITVNEEGKVFVVPVSDNTITISDEDEITFVFNFAGELNDFRNRALQAEDNILNNEALKTAHHDLIEQYKAGEIDEFDVANKAEICNCMYCRQFLLDIHEIAKELWIDYNAKKIARREDVQQFCEKIRTRKAELEYNETTYEITARLDEDLTTIYVHTDNYNKEEDEEGDLFARIVETAIDLFPLPFIVDEAVYNDESGEIEIYVWIS